MDLILKCILGAGVITLIIVVFYLGMTITAFITFVGNEIVKLFGGYDSYLNFSWRDLIIGTLAIGVSIAIFILVGSI